VARPSIGIVKLNTCTRGCDASVVEYHSVLAFKLDLTCGIDYTEVGDFGSAHRIEHTILFIRR
jgi:hypothetical protein